MAYLAVGFGSHHWDGTDSGGGRRFVTVDDLRTRRRLADEPLGAGYDRLHAALASAVALRGAGRDFVVAPVPAMDGEPLIRLGDSFAAAVYPLVGGESPDFTPGHRLAVLELLVAVHSALTPCRATATGRLGRLRGRRLS